MIKEGKQDWLTFFCNHVQSFAQCMRAAQYKAYQRLVGFINHVVYHSSEGSSSGGIPAWLSERTSWIYLLHRRDELGISRPLSTRPKPIHVGSASWVLNSWPNYFKLAPPSQNHPLRLGFQHMNLENYKHWICFSWEVSQLSNPKPHHILNALWCWYGSPGLEELWISPGIPWGLHSFER